MITIEDRNQLITKLETIKDSLFTNKKIDEIVDEILTKEEKQIVMKTTPLTQNNIEKLITSLKSVPIIELTLAQDPTVATLNHISEWLQNTLNTQVLITYKVDQTIIAGAQIGYRGMYKDYSIAKTV